MVRSCNPISAKMRNPSLMGHDQARPSIAQVALSWVAETLTPAWISTHWNPRTEGREEEGRKPSNDRLNIV